MDRIHHQGYYWTGGVTTAPKKKLFTALEDLGLSGYEAQAYLAALRNPPMTGYELAKRSGVPRSRIYETVEKLTARGLLVLQPGDKNLLTAVDHRSFLDQKERESAATISFLRDELASVAAPPDSGIWTVTGRERILELAHDLIAQATRYVYLSVTELDLERIAASVAARRPRVAVHGIYCADREVEIPGLVKHLGSCCAPCGELALIVDGEQCLAGATHPDETASAALTRNAGLIGIAREYVRHEIFINALHAGADTEAQKAYARRYQRTMKALP